MRGSKLSQKKDARAFRIFRLWTMEYYASLNSELQVVQALRCTLYCLLKGGTVCRNYQIFPNAGSEAPVQRGAIAFAALKFSRRTKWSMPRTKQAVSNCNLMERSLANPVLSFTYLLTASPHEVFRPLKGFPCVSPNVKLCFVSGYGQWSTRDEQ